MPLSDEQLASWCEWLPSQMRQICDECRDYKDRAEMAEGERDREAKDARHWNAEFERANAAIMLLTKCECGCLHKRGDFCRQCLNDADIQRMSDMASGGAYAEARDAALQAALTREEKASNRSRRLLELLNRALDALVWCSGSPSFAPEGEARDGWMRMTEPLIREIHRELEAEK